MTSESLGKLVMRSTWFPTQNRRIPRTIECELTGDLVDACLPGDIVTVTGEVKVWSTDDFQAGKKDQGMFLLYILANSVSRWVQLLKNS